MRRVGLLLLMGALAGCGNVDTTPPAESAGAAPADADEDGIADEQDLIPCAGVQLIVTNVSVEDAALSLNGEPVIDPGAFPTVDVVQSWLNVATGMNTIEIASELGAYDELHVVVETDDKSVRFLDETLTGETALPEVAFGFEVTASCAGY